MTVLVIGANGHLGAHLVRQLLDAGNPVRALVRRTSETKALEGISVEIVRGDIQQPHSLLEAVEECEEVYHLAAPTHRVPDASAAIVQGTRNVLHACQHARARRLVYVSSIVTIGYSWTADVILDERTNQRTDATTYHTAKWVAEQDVIKFGRTEGLSVVIVNPATLIGPLDYRVTPSNAPIQWCLEGGLRIALPGGVTVVHVEDAARGLLQAMQHGRTCERYILGGDRLTIREYFALIAKECGRPGPLMTLPRAAVMAAGIAFSAVERLSGRRMPLTFSQARHLVGKYGWYSSDKAVRELGYSWRPAAEAVKEYVSWVRCGRPSTYR
jgi:dihydroflavonol-4-reductase